MKKILLFVLCLILMAVIICANSGCSKEHIPAPQSCGTVWDKGKNNAGEWQLIVDDRTVKVDSTTWAKTPVNSLYCQ